MALRSSPHVDADVDHRSGPWRVAQRALLIAYVAALTGLVIYAIATGPQRRAALDREIAQQLAEEDREFCQKLGKEFGTSEFSTCAASLAEIRARHKDRVLRDLSPIL